MNAITKTENVSEQPDPNLAHYEDPSIYRCAFKAGGMVAEFHDASECTFDGREWYVASLRLTARGRIEDTFEAGTKAACEDWCRTQLARRLP